MALSYASNDPSGPQYAGTQVKKPAATNPLLPTAYADEKRRKESLSEQKILAAQRAAELAQEGVTGLQTAQQQGLEALERASVEAKAQAARGLAASLASAPRTGLGAQSGAAAQAAKESGIRQTQEGLARAQYQTQAQQQMSAAQLAAQAAQQQAIESAIETGSSKEEAQKKKAQYDAQVQKIVQDNSFLGITNDGAVADEIERLIALEDNQEIIDYYAKLASDIRSGLVDV